jgi:hypothetical protein
VKLQREHEQEREQKRERERKEEETRVIEIKRGQEQIRLAKHMRG